MESGINKKIRFLIVDTSAFIQNAGLQDLGEKIITVPEVINEIKNKRQLRRLIVLPYDLEIKDPYPENVKFVNDFSKKTGDYASLSATDVNVIALTYQLEKEINGSDHLNAAPLFKPTIAPINSTPDKLTNVVGFHIPKKESKSRTLSSCSYETEKFSVSESDEDEEFDDAREDVCLDEFQDTNPISFTETELLSNEITNANDELKEEEENNSNYGDDNDCDEDEDDWITPQNILQAKNKIADDLEENFEDLKVACLTTDFSMQNVLKQIGLNVISLDGKLIKQLRTFILRCYGCFKTTSIMTKVFCPNCGNKTLKKVAISVNADGTQNLHINFRKPLTAKGKRFSLPLPRGGKHSNNPILCEDQPMPQQRTSRLSRIKNNPLDDDYIAGYSPFVMRDVTSKSAMMGIKPHIEMKHWMKQNPNKSKKKKR